MAEYNPSYKVNNYLRLKEEADEPLSPEPNNFPSYEELIEEQGGQGFFQWLAWSIISPAINLNGMLIYQFSYLLLLPKFSCDELIDGKWTALIDGTPEYD